jgi:hypothetical protein
MTARVIQPICNSCRTQQLESEVEHKRGTCWVCEHLRRAAVREEADSMKGYEER